MFENPRRGRLARNFTTNVPKILDLKSSSEHIFSRKLSLGAPVLSSLLIVYAGDRLRLFFVCQISNFIRVSRTNLRNPEIIAF